MKTLKLSLEYHCYPIWFYAEDGSLIDNDLPEELRSDTELDNILLDIQNTFDELYTNNSNEFSSHDFSSVKEQVEFKEKINKALELLVNKYGNDYNIESKFIDQT